MQKTKSILYGFHDDDLESFIKRALQAQGYEVVSTVKYGISSIVQYAADNPIDAIIMRCNTMSELEKARDLRDLNATLILLVTAGMRGTPEIEEALSSGLNNIVFAGLRSHSKNLRTEIVDIIREERSQKQARVYYGFAPLERPACFSGELSIKNEQQLLMLYEYLLDKTDPRELDVRFEKVLGMLPAEERSEMARTLPVPIKSLLRDSVSYQQAMTPERKKKGGFFRKKQEEPQEDSAGTEVALSGSSNLMDTINQLVEQYHHHQFGEWEVVRPATEQEEGEERRRCVCGHEEIRTIPRIAASIPQKEEEEIVLVPPSCSESGKYQMICERCSEAVSEEETIPELDHDFSEWTIQKAADCEHTGERVRTCKKCGIQESRTISKLGHEWVDKKTLPTCIAEGRLERVCMRCGKTELVETLPVAGHAFGKWKMSGFKDTRTCEVCGKVESRTAYKRIVAVAVCGAAIVGVAGVAIFLKKSASSEGSDYMDSKNVVHSTALIDESRESGETVSDFSKADLQVANDGKATSAATLTSAAFEEESETVEAVTETIEEGSDTLVQETDSEEETISAEAFTTEEAKEDSQKWESTFEESRIESSESQTTELEIESTQPESIEFTSEAVMPEETDYGAITNLFLPTTLKTPETLQQLFTAWESRRKLLHWDTGILGDSSAYLVSQAQLEKLSAFANGQIADWQKNEQNTVAETVEEQIETQASEALPEAQTSSFENQG